jgi:ATP-dependent DNA helicase RecG
LFKEYRYASQESVRLNNAYYQSLLISYINKFSPAKRADIEAYLLDKLPQVLDDIQKRNKIKNMLQAFRKQGVIMVTGKIWMFVETKD